MPSPLARAIRLRETSAEHSDPAEASTMADDKTKHEVSETMLRADDSTGDQASDSDTSSTPLDKAAATDLELDDGRPTLKPGLDPDGSREWLAPDGERPGPQETTDPRTAPTPAGADIDTGLASTLASFGDLGRGVRTSPNHHGVGSTFPVGAGAAVGEGPPEGAMDGDGVPDNTG